MFLVGAVQESILSQDGPVKVMRFYEDKERLQDGSIKVKVTRYKALRPSAGTAAAVLTEALHRAIDDIRQNELLLFNQ